MVMNETNSPLRQLRTGKGLSQAALAKICDVSTGTISNWENGIYDIDNRSLRLLADYFNVSTDFLLGKEVKKPWVPVLGDVAAGIPIAAIEAVSDEWEQIDTDSPAEYFALRIKGDSMEPRMKSGDVVIVHRQPLVENGEVAVIKVGTEEATVKTVKITDQGVWLLPMNPSYQPIFFTLNEVRSLPVTIAGRVVELRAKF